MKAPELYKLTNLWKDIPSHPQEPDIYVQVHYYNDWISRKVKMGDAHQRVIKMKIPCTKILPIPITPGLGLMASKQVNETCEQKFSWINQAINEAKTEALEALRNPEDPLVHVDILARFKNLVVTKYWREIASLESTTIGCYCRGAQSFCVAEILIALFIEKYSHRIHLQDFLDTETRVIQLISNTAELMFLKTEPAKELKRSREEEEEEETASYTEDEEGTTTDSSAEIFEAVKRSAQVMGVDVSWMTYRESAWLNFFNFLYEFLEEIGMNNWKLKQKLMRIGERELDGDHKMIGDPKLVVGRGDWGPEAWSMSSKRRQELMKTLFNTLTRRQTQTENQLEGLNRIWSNEHKASVRENALSLMFTSYRSYLLNGETRFLAHTQDTRGERDNQQFNCRDCARPLGASHVPWEAVRQIAAPVYQPAVNEPLLDVSLTRK